MAAVLGHETLIYLSEQGAVAGSDFAEWITQLLWRRVAIVCEYLCAYLHRLRCLISVGLGLDLRATLRMGGWGAARRALGSCASRGCCEREVDMSRWARSSAMSTSAGTGCRRWDACVWLVERTRSGRTWAGAETPHVDVVRTTSTYSSRSSRAFLGAYCNVHLVGIPVVDARGDVEVSWVDLYRLCWVMGRRRACRIFWAALRVP
ncbi:hypothetical protein B0H16DRAFT_1722954 [Mycena metata]|uniref:Uncharacterized protein n=1 Tax=Mycena metata TaxID=1033252 RepID=A0AAD7J1E4_9AGAR|nr:hypothetical protein B0H16DRAFT_1722954 [Mycena metata]